MSRNKSRDQKDLRERRGEDAYLFGPNDQCLGKVERDRWEDAVSWVGGSVAEAVRECGLEVPRSTRVLWGRSAQEALSTYRKWQGGISKRCGKVKGDVTIPGDLEVWDGLEPVPGKARRHEEGYAGAGHVVEGGIRGS